MRGRLTILFIALAMSASTTFAQTGTYEGTLGADGNIIAGTWTLGGKPLPLRLVKATPTTTWTIPEPLPPPQIMDPDAKPGFEVGTIKPSDPNQVGPWSMNINRSGIFTTRNMTLSGLIKFAYSVHPRQIIGAPSWIESDKFDLTAKPDKPGVPNVDQTRAMLQKLLVDRFSLAFHNDKRELSAYVITAAKGGPKLRKEEDAPIPNPSFFGNPRRGFNVRNATITEFASWIQADFMEQPVVDQTGLGKTRYSFVLEWTPDPSQRGPAPPNPEPAAPDTDAPPDLSTAMVQQLGLRMKITKALVDVMVIDKVQKPTEN